MVIMMSGLEEREAALRAVAEGAYDFFQKPFDMADVAVRLLERGQALDGVEHGRGHGALAGFKLDQAHASARTGGAVSTASTIINGQRNGRVGGAEIDGANSGGGHGAGRAAGRAGLREGARF